MIIGTVPESESAHTEPLQTNLYISTETVLWSLYGVIENWFSSLDFRTKLLVLLISWLVVNTWLIHIAWKKYGGKLNELNSKHPMKEGSLIVSITQGRIKGGQAVIQTVSLKIFRVFLKSEGKEEDRKKGEGCLHFLLRRHL